ncbi:UPF0711 protein C18orf21 homolog [Hemicordylus capensis]|uniref:UPF0711 protein C18orf21 homolog n=1 Tax=Hemicordylus capensis TaxID=884348 RepID=UPI00230375E4|nr:UPF0711 protein C18orf21 homolog [Hemicordylus capensis]
MFLLALSGVNIRYFSGWNSCEEASAPVRNRNVATRTISGSFVARFEFHLSAARFFSLLFLTKSMGRRRQFLEGAARQLAGACPPQARFLLWTLSNIEGKNLRSEEQVCPYCFQFLLPGSYRVRLRSKMKVTPQIQKLLNLEKKYYKLNLKQTKLLKQYKESKNILIITCNVCRKITRRYGENRVYSNVKTSTVKTPTSSNKNVPFSSSHSGSKRGKQLFRTSTYEQSTPHSSSGTPRNTKSHFTQLKRLLTLEENKKSNKGDLRNFLSSL